MSENDFDEFADALEECGFAFMCNVRRSTSRVYFKNLSDYPLGLVQHALFCWIRQMGDFPTIFDLLNVLSKARIGTLKESQKVF